MSEIQHIYNTLIFNELHDGLFLKDILLNHAEELFSFNLDRIIDLFYALNFIQRADVNYFSFKRLHITI